MLVKIIFQFQMHITNVHSKQPKSTIIITEYKKRVLYFLLFIYIFFYYLVVR